MIQQILFALVAIVAFSWGGRQFMKIRRNVLLGKDTPMADNSGARLKNVLLIAFGQKKMFKRWIPAIFHLFIYVAFLFTQIELIEIFIDGIFGVHRFFAPMMGGLYTFLISSIEVLSLLQQIDPQHYTSVGATALSSWMGPAIFGGMEQGTLVGIERFGYDGTCT